MPRLSSFVSFVSLGPFVAPLLVVTLCSCASVNYRSVRIDRAPASIDLLNELEPGRTELGQCLEWFGAPTSVLEDQQTGAILTWAWRRSEGWGFGISPPLSTARSGSFNYNRDADLPNRLQLRFSADWVLTDIHLQGPQLPENRLALDDDAQG